MGLRVFNPRILKDLEAKNNTLLTPRPSIITFAVPRR